MQQERVRMYQNHRRWREVCFFEATAGALTADQAMAREEASEDTAGWGKDTVYDRLLGRWRSETGLQIHLENRR